MKDSPLSYAEAFSKHFGVLLFDYRSFGRSRESRDCVQVCERFGDVIFLMLRSAGHVVSPSTVSQL